MNACHALSTKHSLNATAQHTLLFGRITSDPATSSEVPAAPILTMSPGVLSSLSAASPSDQSTGYGNAGTLICRAS